jgi:uncharacterized protein VirK/YbjX
VTETGRRTPAEAVQLFQSGRVQLQSRRPVKPLLLLSNVVSLISSTFHVTINLIQGAAKKDLVNFLHKLKDFVSDESPFSMVSGYVSIIYLLNKPSLKVLLNNNRFLATKYFRSYLVKDFRKSVRRECLRCHYDYLLTHLTDAFSEQLMTRPVLLWRREIDRSTYTISLDYNLDFPADGDLRLVFAQDEYPLYDLIFSIIPGKFIGSATAHALLITNVQGAVGKTNEIRQAMKACNRIAPPYVLVNAAEAIAGALEIDLIVGVSNDKHLWKTEPWSSDFSFDYDQFWESFPGTKSTTGFYEICIPIPITSLERVKSNQRRRAIRKIELRAEISGVIRDVFSKLKRDKHTGADKMPAA